MDEGIYPVPYDSPEILVLLLCQTTRKFGIQTSQLFIKLTKGTSKVLRSSTALRMW